VFECQLCLVCHSYSYYKYWACVNVTSFSNEMFSGYGSVFSLLRGQKSAMELGLLLVQVSWLLLFCSGSKLNFDLFLLLLVKSWLCIIGRFFKEETEENVTWEA
jgi:hypothetical protein